MSSFESVSSDTDSSLSNISDTKCDEPKSPTMMTTLNDLINVCNNAVELANKVECDLLDGHEKQIDQLKLSFNFDEWYKEHFLTSMKRFRSSQKHQQKSLQIAFDYQKMAEAYIGMRTSHRMFVQKAFDFINKAIKFAPHDEYKFLCECFIQRSTMHRYDDAFESALTDIEIALHFRPHSFTAITTKLDLLRKMDRQIDAYKFVDHVLNTEPMLSKGKRGRLMQIKTKLRMFATSNNETNILDVSNVEEDNLVKLDPRIKLIQNVNGRFGFEAIESIEKNEFVLHERPSLFSLKRDGLETRCLACWKECETTFWPCPNCSEVIFCSIKCSTSYSSTHESECGLLNLLNELDSTKVHMSQAYKFIQITGLERLINLDPTTWETNNGDDPFPLDEHYETLLDSERGRLVNEIQIKNWFITAQFDLCRLVYERSPSRTGTDLAKAIMLIALHIKQNRIEHEEMPNEKWFKLITIVSTLLSCISVYEYTWNDRTSSVSVGSSRKSISSFQCLFGSRIGHSCSSNAEWRFDGNYFTLKTTKTVNVGDPLNISFGINYHTTPSFYERQSTLNQFLMLCSCTHCMSDSRKHFCLRCCHCGGPVPWNETKLPHNRRCMVCERVCTNASNVRYIERTLHSIRRCIWLVDHSDQLPSIEQQMCSLANYVHPNMIEFLATIRELGEKYLQFNQFEMAVEWFQWLSTEFNIQLTASDNGDLLKRFKHYDCWASAYVAYLNKSLVNVVDEHKMTCYMKVGSRIIDSMKTCLNQWIEKVEKDRVVVVESDGTLFNSLDYQSMATDSMKSSILDKTTRLSSICKGIVLENVTEQMSSGDKSSSANIPEIYLPEIYVTSSDQTSQQ